MALSLRDATPADYPAFARLFPALRVLDPLPTPAQFEAELLPRMVVAEEGADCVAYTTWRYYGRTAHVVHVVVDERARGRSIGRALMDAVRGRALAAGATRWYLNVKKDNAAALRLYEKCGLAVESRAWSMRAEWTDLLALPGTSDAAPFEPTESEAGALAARLGIDPARLALVRARVGNVFVALRDDSGGGALGVFDPAFPGIYPIAAARPEIAPVLFAAFYPHARERHVNVVVEGDAALADALLGGGATLAFEILRMGAVLAHERDE